MNPMTSRNQNTTWLTFFSFYLVWLFSGLFIYFWFPLGILEKHININYTNEKLDYFFKYYTWFGDGFFFAIILLITFFNNKYVFNRLAVAFIIQTILVQASKSIFFADYNRPLSVLGNTFKPHLVSGVSTHLLNSFPSGHTATAFTLAACITLMFHNKSKMVSIIIGLTLFTAALLVGYSRIYLFQHFFRDVIFGSLYGLISFEIAHQIIKRYQK